MLKESVDKQVNAKVQDAVNTKDEKSYSIDFLKTQAPVGNSNSVNTTKNESGDKEQNPFDRIRKIHTIKENNALDSWYGQETADKIRKSYKEYKDRKEHAESNCNTDGVERYSINFLPSETNTNTTIDSSAGKTESKVDSGANVSKKVTNKSKKVTNKSKTTDTGKDVTSTEKDKGASTTGKSEGANSKVVNSGDNIESRSNNDNITQSTQVIDAGKSLDDSTAAASYAASVTNGAINHIFHNNHYQDDPVPAWSFSVDFVPLCITDKRFTNLFTLEDSKTLTKAVLNVTANEKTINTQSINYLGLQHPFFTKLAQSHGDLKITFAEDELFSISTILKNVLKYASYLPNFPTNKVYEVKQGNWFDEIIIAHNASDSISPKYRLNATDLQITDENTASLAHDYKFVFDILLKIYRPGNAHIFADEAAPPGFVYHFHKCWLKNTGGIELNYDDDKPIDRPVIFSYQYMSGVPYHEWVSRNNVLSESQELDKAYDEAAQRAVDAASNVVQEAKEYSRNSPTSFTDTGEPVSTSLTNFLDDTKNSKLNYLFK